MSIKSDSTHSMNAGDAADAREQWATQSIQSQESLAEQLIGSLDDLVKVYRNLLEVVRKEKEILTEGQLDDLIENNKVKDAMLVRIRTLENQRTRLARDLTLIVGGDHDQPRLLDLANRCSEKHNERLRNLHAVLELLVRRVAELNKQNEHLVQAALDHISGAIDSIRDGLKPKPVYARQGQIADVKAGGGRLVSREA